MPMMDMMKGMMGNMPMMNMMNMMETMQAAKMMGPGMGGMATIDRVEGRIAFLRTELKITDAQAGAWDAFAETLRANARKLGEIRASMMGRSADAQQQAPTMADRLDRQEQWLLARLEGTRAMKAAFTKLNETLSDEQKKTANDLLAAHMGMGMMAMMGAQMQPGQMQRGQMGPGRMQPGQMQPPGTGNK
ncbi:Spy/CpxP family protein refolding chaperone [Bradyrhizobium sediminis]|nr:Spy/CpxP family protein refolding chaperone [Bradyrhizobium sediminis]